MHDLARDGVQRWIAKRFAGYDDSGDWRPRDLPRLDWDRDWRPNLMLARREAGKWTAVIRISSSGGEGQHSSTNPSELGAVMMLRADKFPIAGALKECPICGTAWDEQPFTTLRHVLREVWGPSALPDPEENAHNSAGLLTARLEDMRDAIAETIDERSKDKEENGFRAEVQRAINAIRNSMSDTGGGKPTKSYEWFEAMTVVAGIVTAPDFAEWEATEWRARQGAADAANDEGEMREITIAQVRANAAAKVAKAAVEASRIVARGVARWRKAAGLNKWTGSVRGDREAESEEEEEKEEAEGEEEEEEEDA